VQAVKSKSDDRWRSEGMRPDWRIINKNSGKEKGAKLSLAALSGHRGGKLNAVAALSRSLTVRQKLEREEVLRGVV
jgi:hypothetical protein